MELPPLPHSGFLQDMLNFADEIKERVSMCDVCAEYGIQVNYNNKAICPFHNDSHASMHIYAKQGGWYCFVCNEGGDVIYFVQRYFGLDFQSACEKINTDFQLGLPIGKRLNLREYREAEKKSRERRERIEKEKAEKKALLDEYHLAYDRYVILDRHCIEYAPERMNGVICDFYADAVRDLEIAKDALCRAEMRLYEYEHQR